MLDEEEDIAGGFSTVVVKPRGLWEPPVVVSPGINHLGLNVFAWNQPSRVEHVRQEGEGRSSPVDFDGNGAIHRRHTSIATGDHRSTFERGMRDRA